MKKQPEMHKPADQVIKALRIYAALLVSFLLLSWIVYFCDPTFDRRPLFGAYDQFRDLLNYYGKTQHLRHSSAALGKGLPVFSYTPPAAFLWKALLIIPHHPLMPYFLLLLLAILSFAFLGISTCGQKGRSALAATDTIGITALLGWPLWFVADRANLEGLTWAISGAAICFFLRKKYRASAVCIALAGCIKPFPFALCFLLLLRRKYREVALTAGIAAVIVFAAYVVIGPNPWKAYQDLKPGFALYNRQYIQTIRPVDELRFSHSILDEAKLVAAVVHTNSFHPLDLYAEIPRLRIVDAGWRPVLVLASIYPLIASLAFAALFMSIRKAPALNQVTILAIAATLLPPNSGEYTLLNLYVPFGAFIVFLVREVATGSVFLKRGVLLSLLVVFGLLFSPLTFLRIYAGAAKLVLLLALAVLFIRTPMPCSYFGDGVPAELELTTKGPAMGFEELANAEQVS